MGLYTREAAPRGGALKPKLTLWRCVVHNANGANRIDGRDRVCSPSSQGEFITALVGAGIRPALWREEDTTALWKEVESGKATLVFRGENLLVRRREEVRAIVRFRRRGAIGDSHRSGVYTLVPALCAAENGTRRMVPHSTCIFYTHRLPNETPMPAIRRLLEERLGIIGMPLMIKLLATDTEAGNILPGLIGVTLFRLYEVELNKKQFVSDGYGRVGPITSRVFLWRPLLSYDVRAAGRRYSGLLLSTSYMPPRSFPSVGNLGRQGEEGSNTNEAATTKPLASDGQNRTSRAPLHARRLHTPFLRTR